ncbi:Ig-like domain-containing protein [Nonomuraea pusilla]|uniref:Ig-like domain-containing protein n=1 Tax=Nonomuraea pusilla TaxID=46177 RepID=UPI0033238377
MRPAMAIVLALLPAGAGACAAETAAAPATPAVVRVQPPFDARRARPDLGLRVTAEGGRLTKVLAYVEGQRVRGRFDAARTTWRSYWTLKPGAEYTVTATAATATGPVTVASGRFRTRPATRPLRVAAVAPLPGETVGVGMPIVVDFDAPVRYRAAVERALEVRSAGPVEGAWRWVGDTRVVYRTRTFWQPRQQVTFTAHLAGVRAAPGVYGADDMTLAFTVGRSRIDAKSLRGDPVTITATGREYTDDNGWGFWRLPWDEWRSGSALDGSSPVP